MMTTMSDRTSPLATYLNDHLAGAAAGSNLARSIASADVGTAREAPTRQLAEQIDEDRQKLLEIIDQLGIPRQAIKEAVGLLSEKVSKLKLSALGSGTSGLAQFLRLEALIAGVTAKRQLWRTLRNLNLEAPTNGEIDELVRRADGQLAVLDRLHEESGHEVLA
jgi:flagellar biosynthesis/type III secretory pathway chaperone